MRGRSLDICTSSFSSIERLLCGSFLWSCDEFCCVRPAWQGMRMEIRARKMDAWRSGCFGERQPWLVWQTCRSGHPCVFHPEFSSTSPCFGCVRFSLRCFVLGRKGRALWLIMRAGWVVFKWRQEASGAHGYTILLTDFGRDAGKIGCSCALFCQPS